VTLNIDLMHGRLVLGNKYKGLPAMSFHVSARFFDDIIVSTDMQLLNSKISVI
jgi:hypothetical protein